MEKKGLARVNLRTYTVNLNNTTGTEQEAKQQMQLGLSQEPTQQD